MEAELQSQIPGLDHVISEYSVGYLTHASRAYVEDANAPSPLAEAADMVTELLVSASGDFSDKNEKAIRNLVEKFISSLSSADGVDAERRQMPFTAKKLDQAINVGSQRNMSSTLGLAGGNVDLESANSRKVESRVDRKKLEKAERKIRAKQEKKQMKMVQYESSRLLDQPDSTMSYEEFFMAVNPLQLGSDSAAKSKDIKIDSIDTSVGGHRILTDASLTLAYGRRYGLVGQNGIGKSTLLRALSRREVAIPSHISILHVEQEIMGDDTPALQAVLDADVWRKRLLADQDRITKQLTALEAERSSMADTSTDAARLDHEREGLDITLSDIHSKLSEMESDKAESRAASILAGLGFSPERQQFATKTFSGGWRMRLALARALFCEPDLLLLDEPSNMLDVPSITFLSNYLQGYPSTVLVVSHDRAFLNEVATDIVHQHSERLDYYKGANFDSFYATKEERKKNAKREYEKQMAERAHLQAFIDKFRYNAAKSSEAQSRIKKLERMPVLEAPESDYVVHFKFPDVEKLSPPIVQMSEIAFGYSKDKPLLRNVDLDVQLDSRIGIVGPNGAGKTTVLKLLTGQLEPTSGLLSQHARLRIGYFAQHHVDALDLTTSAVSFMAKTYPGKTDEEYRRHLGAFGITGMTGLQKMELLSGGQKSRVAFACLSLTNPHILVLDEPSNHLDIEGMDALSEALQRFEGGVVMVSHDVTMLQNVCTSLWVCDKGTVTKFDGTVNAYKKMISSQANEAGVISSTLVSIDTDLSNRDLTTLDKSLITSCTSLFALVASPLAGILADRLGRRKVIFVADVLFALGAFVQATSNEVWSMIAGRSIVGLAVGGASLVTPIYISELAPSNMRGRLVTILSLFITGGQVVAYIVGWLFSSIDGGWRWIVGLGILPALFQLVILTALPETPRWLAQAGFETTAIVVLEKIYQGHPDSKYVAKQILREIQQEVAEEWLGYRDSSSEAGKKGIHYISQRIKDLFYIGGNRRALIIAMMLQGSQQLCGFNSLMYFSGLIFSFLSFSSPTLTSLSVATTNFLFTLLAFIYIDRIGRRRILLYSIPIMTLSLIVCAIAFSLVSSNLSSYPQTSAGSSDTVTGDLTLPIVILLCLTVYTASYAFGLGNVPWQQSELFPLSVRSLGSALATATNWASNFIVGLTFLPMMELLSPGWTFGTYAVVCAVSWFGVWSIYPEMSGLGLEEVKELLADSWGVKESLGRTRNSS
ncbi:translation initiation regulator (Gcn20) [Aspergillus bombycis]|uniref:Translation initiation regulator (Gcn20) n=1 Tax=Aspergillus bombycis TaxID=109264 RepID=A0A1F7ZSG6_9EURO|nr:translation initiation regulator (Gcn20) [Aspergillus bombycis]OGM42038.1 translation initiation regulator (Gcn20) [Aspergillus bombycis]